MPQEQPTIPLHGPGARGVPEPLCTKTPRQGTARGTSRAGNSRGSPAAETPLWCNLSPPTRAPTRSTAAHKASVGVRRPHKPSITALQASKSQGARSPSMSRSCLTSSSESSMMLSSEFLASDTTQMPHLASPCAAAAASPSPAGPPHRFRSCGRSGYIAALPTPRRTAPRVVGRCCKRHSVGSGSRGTGPGRHRLRARGGFTSRPTLAPLAGTGEELGLLEGTPALWRAVHQHVLHGSEQAAIGSASAR